MTSSGMEMAPDGAQQRIAELESLVGDRDRLAKLLTDAEQRAASIPELERRIADLEQEVSAAHKVAEAASIEAAQLDQMLMYGRRALRLVRPAIKPLRDARRRMRS